MVRKDWNGSCFPYDIDCIEDGGIDCIDIGGAMPGGADCITFWADGGSMGKDLMRLRLQPATSQRYRKKSNASEGSYKR